MTKTLQTIDLAKLKKVTGGTLAGAQPTQPYEDPKARSGCSMRC